MRAEDVRERWPDFDTADVDRWIGVPLGGAHMKDDVHVNDIRRWVQGMQNPNPLYYDEKYAAEGGYLEVTTGRSGDVVSVTVTDRGPGVTPAERGRIFEPFYRVGNALTEGTSGTGIGLTIARELARLHGGELALLSTAAGATFRLTLHSPLLSS